MWDNRVSATILAPLQNQNELEHRLASAGLRHLKSLTLEEARAENIDGPGIVLVDLPEDDARNDSMISHLDRASDEGRLSLIVRTRRAGLDPVVARIQSSDALVLCDPSDDEMMRNLSVAAGSRKMPHILYDGKRARDSDDTGDLHAEVERIASAISRLSDGAVDQAAVQEGGALIKVVEAPTLAAEIHSVLRVRRLREEFFGKKLFADPAWDMMLELFEAHILSKQLTISSLCDTAGVPTTTALRWINLLSRRGIFVRHPDPTDRRRVYIDLSEAAIEALARWFERAHHYTNLAGV